MDHRNHLVRSLSCMLILFLTMWSERDTFHHHADSPCCLISCARCWHFDLIVLKPPMCCYYFESIVVNLWEYTVGVPNEIKNVSRNVRAAIGFWLWGVVGGKCQNLWAQINHDHHYFNETKKKKIITKTSGLEKNTHRKTNRIANE